MGFLSKLFSRDATRTAGQSSTGFNDVWLDEAYDRHQAQRSMYFGPPEVQADGARAALNAGDVGVAMIFAQRALNTLEDSYRNGSMQNRAPSPRDSALVVLLDECVRLAVAEGHGESARYVAGAAKRNLLRCAVAARAADMRSDLYDGGVELLDRQFPGLEEQVSF